MKYIDYTTSTVFVQLLNQFDRMFDVQYSIPTYSVDWLLSLFLSKALSHKFNPAVL